MAFALYSRTFWFPDGSLAAGIPARIFPENSNALAPIFTDITGTIPLPNPLSTDGAGVLTFWAEEGEYWIHIDTESFRVSVGNPNGLDVFDGASVALSTGTMSGGLITFSANPQAIDVPEIVGYVVDYTTDSFRPSLVRVHANAQTVALAGASLTRNVTWWLLNSAGAVIQQATRPTPAQRRANIVLGATSYDTVGGVIYIVQPQPVIEPQPANQFIDLMETLGPYSFQGNAVTPNGANLRINTSGGMLFAHAFSAATTPDNPHEVATAAQTPAFFRYATSTTTVFGPAINTVDPANYDVGGVVTPVPGGAGTTTIQRIYTFGVPNPPDQLTIQYGKTAYASLSTALDRIGQSTGFTPNPIFTDFGTLIAYLVVTKSASDLSNPAQAVIVSAAKFATP